jgi:hypothetical protein
MKLCFCRFILAVMSLFYQACCCQSLKKTE